jgi:hypothetical protein
MAQRNTSGQNDMRQFCGNDRPQWAAGAWLGAVINLLIFLYYPLCFRVPLSPSEPTTLKLCPARLHG